MALASLTERAAQALSAAGVARRPELTADRDALAAALSRIGRSLSDAVLDAEQSIGGLAGPLSGGAASPDFYQGRPPVCAWLGPFATVSRNAFLPSLPPDLVPLGRTTPVAALPLRLPIPVRAADRETRTFAVDDLAMDAAGTVYLSRFSTGGAPVPVSSGVLPFVERLARLLDPAWQNTVCFTLRAHGRAGGAWAAALGLPRVDAASCDRVACWEGPGVLVLEGPHAGGPPDQSTLWTTSFDVLHGAVFALAGPRIPARVGASGAEVERLPLSAAPPPDPRLTVPLAASAFVPETGSLGAPPGAVVQEETHDGRALVRLVVTPDRVSITDCRAAAPELTPHLSPRACAWLDRTGALLDPRRRTDPAKLRARLAALGADAAAPVLDFEARFGGLCLSSQDGSFWLGVGVEIAAGAPLRDGRVPVGAFPGGRYEMDAEGRVWANDEVMELFLVADDARRLLERLAIGQRYPEAAFEWPGSARAEIDSPVAEPLAEALGAVRDPLLSDSVQSVYTWDEGAVWSAPAYAESTTLPCVVVCQSPAVLNAVREVLAERFPDATLVPTGG